MFLLVSQLVVITATDGHNFCDSFNQNNRKMIVFKDRNQQKLLIIGDKYWFLEENDKKLSIINAEGVPNSSPLLSNEYSFAVTVQLKGTADKRTAFYKVFSDSFLL